MLNTFSALILFISSLTGTGGMGADYGHNCNTRTIQAADAALDIIDGGMDMVQNGITLENTTQVVSGLISFGDLGGSKCFTEGTQIVVGAIYDENDVFVQYVTVNIEDINVGDFVYSYDTITGTTELKEVTDVFVRESDHINYLTIIDEEGREQIIETTDSHPFWVVTDEPDLDRAARSLVNENGVWLYHDNIGPTENGFWVEAKDLQVGDVFIGANGELSTLVDFERVVFPEGINVYNFTVEGNHNYFVLAQVGDYGQTSVLVHNGKYSDGFKHALSPEHIKWALKDKKGMGTGINPKTGKPNDHLTEVRNALKGVINNLKKVKKKLGFSNLKPAERIVLEKDLNTLSKMRERVKRILGE